MGKNTQVNHRRTVLKAFSAAMAITLAGSAGTVMAKTQYPERPIRLVVPFPPGGAVDNLARSLSQVIKEQNNMTVIVENRPGAGGTIGASHVAASKPDGYTLMLTPNSVLCMAPHIYPSIKYDTLTDFAPVTKVATSPLVFVVNPKEKINSLPDLIERAKQGSQPVFYGSSGAGSLTHLSGELLSRAADSKMDHIPFKGSAPVLVAVLSGEIQVGVTQIAEMWPHWKSGDLKALAITGEHRSPSLPDVLTAQELGVNGLEAAVTWYGLVAPAGTPEPILSTLNSVFSSAMNDKALLERFSTEGIELKPSSADDFNAQINSEFSHWKETIKETGLKIE